MTNRHFETPILLLGFNRPDYIAQQLHILEQLQPTKLYIATDGPRTNNNQDYIASKEIQKLVKIAKFNVKPVTLFRDGNLGCRVAVSNAIDWFFEQEEEGIILEDDCQPDLSFFKYAQELLATYRDHKRVMHISGTTFLSEKLVSDSYAVMSHPLCWGWATWRRAWKKYDVDMSDWPTAQKKGLLKQPFLSEKAQQYWAHIFDLMFHKKVDTWDYQWAYAIWKNQGLCLLPQTNLVKNIGYDLRATHTKLSFLSLTTPMIKPMQFPLRHPELVRNLEVDKALQKKFEGTAIRQVLTKVMRFLRG